jgi:hypothetical protein
VKKILSLFKQDKGYSMAEILVATVIAGVIAGVTSVAIGTGLRMSATIDQRAINQVLTSRVIEGITSNITLANPIEGVARDSIVLVVGRNVVCEKHRYYVKYDQDGVPYSLHHEVQQVPIVLGTNCRNLRVEAWENADIAIDRTEIEGLYFEDPTQPVFSYYTLGGSKIRVPGDPGYSALTDMAMACMISKVSITLPIKDGEGDVKVVKTEAAPRASSMGALC